MSDFTIHFICQVLQFISYVSGFTIHMCQVLQSICVRFYNPYVSGFTIQLICVTFYNSFNVCRVLLFISLYVSHFTIHFIRMCHILQFILFILSFLFFIYKQSKEYFHLPILQDPESMDDFQDSSHKVFQIKKEVQASADRPASPTLTKLRFKPFKGEPSFKSFLTGGGGEQESPKESAPIAMPTSSGRPPGRVAKS